MRAYLVALTVHFQTGTGVAFEMFFQSTPDDLILIADQLYGPVAVPLSTGEHRTVSHAHLAKELGAAARTRTQLAAAKVPMVVSHPVAVVRGALWGEHSMRSP